MTQTNQPTTPASSEPIVVGGRECEFWPLGGDWQGRWCIREESNPRAKLFKDGHWRLPYDDEYSLDDWTWPTRSDAEQFAREVAGREQSPAADIRPASRPETVASASQAAESSRAAGGSLAAPAGRELPDGPGAWERRGDMGIEAWNIIVIKRSLGEQSRLHYAGWCDDVAVSGLVHESNLPRSHWHQLTAPAGEQPNIDPPWLRERIKREIDDDRVGRATDQSDEIAELRAKLAGAERRIALTGGYHERTEKEVMIQDWIDATGHDAQPDYGYGSIAEAASDTEYLLGLVDAGRNRVHDAECQVESLTRDLAAARKQVAGMRAKLQTIVCTEEPDRGVVLLSSDGPTHFDPDHKVQVYDHENFSPLGDALIELWEMSAANPAWVAGPPGERPKIVCLCGSGRFLDRMAQIEFDETLAGKIVLTIGCTNIDIQRAPDLAHHKPLLDELHLRRIDLADEVLIVNVGGYIGESTRRELDYAKRAGKAIRFLEPRCCECAGKGEVLDIDDEGERWIPCSTCYTPPATSATAGEEGA